MFALSLLGVRSRLVKYRGEKSAAGHYVTSSDLLRVATKFEETIISGRSQEIALGLKDPFVTLGEPHFLSKRQKRGKTDSPKEEILETTENEPDD